MSRPNTVYERLKHARSKGDKLLAVLIDPDRYEEKSLKSFLGNCELAGADLILLGGSLITRAGAMGHAKLIKSYSRLPVVLFPGSPMQLDADADALLLLALISGRNPELLIGHHVIAAPYLKQSGLEIISTGYMLIDGGISTTASYISGTQPIPCNKPEIAATTAMAGEMLGNSLIYLDAGSGAVTPVSQEMITAVRKSVELPLIVGGGLRSAGDCLRAYQAGADMVVVGTAFEENPSFVKDFRLFRDKIISVS